MILRLLFLFIAACATAWTASAHATSYEAKLPPELASSPRLCDYAPCREVLPGATEFSERRGNPPYVEAYAERAGKRTLVGYVFLSTDIVDIPAYSGKPVVTLIGMDTQGKFAGVRILKHSEPILLLGIPEDALARFNDQYLGKFVGDNLEIGRSQPEQGVVGLDAITGATVTVIAQNQVMLQSAGAVARQVGILKASARPQAQFTSSAAPRDWAGLVAEGSVQRLVVTPQDLGLDPEGKPYLELWFGLLDVPAVGKTVLGEQGYENLQRRLAPGEHALFVVRTDGAASFKGSGYVRGGLYDRVQVRQGRDTFTFRDLDYLNLYGLEAAGAPAYTESALFLVRGKAFSAAYPWQFVFLGNKMDKSTGSKTFASFEREYWVPERYLSGGRPQIEKPQATWVRMWRDKAAQLAGFVLLLAMVATAYAQRERLARRSTHKNKLPINLIKYTGWAVAVGFVGIYQLAQPSITQVLTWFHSLLFQWKWELFLSDPFIFVFWIFIIATVFIWGRGLFCGWLCPFGSLTEILYKLGSRLGLKRFQFALPMRWNDRLKYVKYVVFMGLLAVSFYDMGLAEKLAEVEPFKTTFLVGITHRSWPYALFAASILGVSIFIERPFCKYLCPLGAALAMPSTFRWFGLKRKQECNTCKACAHGCGSLAIDRDGRIDQRECLLCLDCLVLYYDDHGCPPLAQERKRRTKAGLPLTPIGANGYYIPIKAVPAEPRAGQA